MRQPLTVACLAFRLRRPRPSWWRIALQPGTAAMTACAIFFAIRAVEVGLALALPDVSALGGFEMSRISPIQFNDGASLALVRTHTGSGVISRIEAVGCHGTYIHTDRGMGVAPSGRGVGGPHGLAVGKAVTPAEPRRQAAGVTSFAARR